MEGFFSEGERLKQEQEVVGPSTIWPHRLRRCRNSPQAFKKRVFANPPSSRKERCRFLARWSKLAGAREPSGRVREGPATQWPEDPARAGFRVVQSIGIATLGSAVAANQPLLTIAPGKHSADCGSLAQQQRYRVREVGADGRGQARQLSFTQYGSVAGKVKWISADAEFQDPRALDKQVGTSQLVLEIATSMVVVQNSERMVLPIACRLRSLAPTRASGSRDALKRCSRA